MLREITSKQKHFLGQSLPQRPIVRAGNVQSNDPFPFLLFTIQLWEFLGLSIAETKILRQCLKLPNLWNCGSFLFFFASALEQPSDPFLPLRNKYSHPSWPRHQTLPPPPTPDPRRGGSAPSSSSCTAFYVTAVLTTFFFIFFQFWKKDRGLLWQASLPPIWHRRIKVV